MLKILIILLILINFNFNLLSQNNKFIDNTTKLDLILLDPVSDINEILFKSYGENLYFTSKIIEEKKEFYYDLVEIDKNKKISHFKIIIPENLTNRIWLKDFEIYNKEVYLNLQYEIAVFKLNENKIYNYFMSIPKKKIFEGIKVIDNKLYGFGCKFDLNIESDSTLTFLWTFDLKENKEKLTFFEDPLGIEWTQIQPRKLIDLNKNKLIIIDAKRYKIRIYDIFTNELIDAFEILDEINNENVDLSKYHKLQNINKIIPSITNKLFSKRTMVDLIESVNLISENKIIVIKSIGDSLNEKCLKYFDIWEKKNKKWERICKNSISGMPLKDNLFAFENMFIENLIFSQEYFISAQALPLKLEERFFNMKFKDINKLKEEYASENEIRYSLLIGKIK